MSSKKQYTDVARVARALFESVSSPYSAAKSKLLAAGDWSEIARSKITPAAYDIPYLFARDYACHSFLKKLSFDHDALRLHEEALQQFLSVESGVARTNHRLRYSSLHSDAEGILSYAKRKIERVLGDFDVGEFLEGCGWGPGSTSTLRGDRSTVDIKVLERAISVTGRALPIARAYLSSDASWMRARLGDSVAGPCSPMSGEFHVSEDGRFATVTKDMNRRRSIDIQPTFNLFLQKGVGKMIRRRLKRCGIDLDDQSRNQSLAQSAYSAGLCTIDLESASDTVSHELVRLLLPAEWYAWMDKLRTHQILLKKGLSHRLHKFSAMGNGFTFELESLIFYSLCWAVVRCEADDVDSPISVYGDDIIVAAKHFERVRFVLTQCGFTINDTKSFWEGPFYESCGKHFFKGFDVTPPIQKEAITDSPSAVRCANRLWRWAHRMGAGLCLDNVAFQAFGVASGLAREKCQFKYMRKVVSLPTQPWWLEGDGGLISDVMASSDVNGIMRLPLFVSSSRKRKGYADALLHESLRSLEFVPYEERLDSMPSYGYVTPRGDVKWSISGRRVYVQERACPEWC